ncbi:MAG: MiaB/RimO family radical SAM methylthiotransferase, partial [Chloroflexota bacterium]
TQEVVLTGCWSTQNPEIASSMPGVSQVIPNAEKDHLVPQVLNIPEEEFNLEPLSRELIPGARLRTRAFIKVQDGCDNRCSFCITTLARGRGRSRPVADILANINEVVNDSSSNPSSAKEVVLTGVHLGSWGSDFSNPLHLSDLVKTILRDTDVPRLRLSSLEPWDLDEDFFSLWDDTRLCRHLHLPLQSGSADVLRRMARKTTPGAFASLVEAARAACPEIAITTDLIAGFPGETEQEFLETMDFVRKVSFAGGHVFTYSPRPGTAAESMPDQVPFPLRKERNAMVREVLFESEQAYQNHFINHTLPVLWESVTSLDSDIWHLRGLTDNYLRVSTQAPHQLWNQITPVLLTRIKDRGFEGVIPPI